MKKAKNGNASIKKGNLLIPFMLLKMSAEK